MTTVLNHHDDRASPTALRERAGMRLRARQGADAVDAPEAAQEARGRGQGPEGGAPPFRAVAELPAVPRADGLPDPAPLAANLALRVIEVLAGARNIDQLSRWVSDSVFVHLLRRTTISERTRKIAGTPVQRPRLWVGEPYIATPRDGVIEAVVLVHQPNRTRAVAMRLDVVGSRWRASAMTVL
ncbi:Rv3235 family protein [Leifsonia sp. Le1]|uniref:Rv3235 family protein n=1 Tax=Leifsonia sp. Le1 TaxID=3404918 RepID=UPI003EB7ED77